MWKPHRRKHTSQIGGLNMNARTENDRLMIALSGRIDTNNAAETEREILSILAENAGKEIAFDAAALEYISSAGLRVLMKVRKSAGKSVSIENVSREVYDIFETTGFTEILEVKKALRKINIEGMELIGQGATAKVYRMDPETVVKVFNPGVSAMMVNNENVKSKTAFLNGIPTAISYDTVKVGDCFGTVFELLNAEDFISVLRRDKAHLKEHIGHFARSIRVMHTIEVDPEQFLSVRQASLNYLPALEGTVCTHEEVEKLRRLYEIIPERSTFIHGDLHPGNVMVQDGEFVFIDLSSGGKGHPIFDMVSMCAIYFLNAQNEESRKNGLLLRGFSKEECMLIWDTFLRTYLDTNDEALVQKAQQQILAVSSARMLFAAIAVPGLLSETQINVLRSTALGYVDSGLEPLCF
jgi:uncharacterized protein (TIGR02172 family)